MQRYSYQDVCWWKLAFMQSAEMRNFSAAECGKVITGNLRNVPHLSFRKLPLDNFPHSTIRIPQNTRAQNLYIFPQNSERIAVWEEKLSAVKS